MNAAGIPDPQSEIRALAASDNPLRALPRLGQIWNAAPRASTAAFVLSQFALLRESRSFPVLRLAILRSFTVEPIAPLTRAFAATHGIDLQVHVGGFNAYAQEILDPASPLYSFRPDAVLVAAQTRDIAPELWDGFEGLTESEARAAADRVAGVFASMISALRRNSEASLVLHNLETPSAVSGGILDGQREFGQAEAIREINRRLMERARVHRGVYLLDYEGLVARHGRNAWHDEEKWISMRMPVAAGCLHHLAAEWMRFVAPLAGKSCKVVAVDLDNTLWGGTVGEDGPAGIRLGSEHPGAAHLALQRALLDLRARGILLAVCSKNNNADAMEVIEQHPAMLLRSSHFSALRINWNDKASNLREIAAELNVGADAIAFVDDNPTERAWVRSEMPEATVIDLPEDPLQYAAAVRSSPVFERLSVSGEDLRRGDYYSAQRLRTDLERGAASLEDFYRSLAMKARIEEVTPETLPRAAQLTQKTNQFNLTTKRYTERQMENFMAAADCRVYMLSLEDRFGDNGIVGLAMVVANRRDRSAEIDTFLLSCRVIGRTAETALLARIAEDARNDGMTQLYGTWLRTAKNQPACNFYPGHGFVCVSSGEGESRYEFDLTAGRIDTPSWIEIPVARAQTLSL